MGWLLSVFSFVALRGVALKAYWGLGIGRALMEACI